MEDEKNTYKECPLYKDKLLEDIKLAKRKHQSDIRWTISIVSDLALLGLLIYSIFFK